MTGMSSVWALWLGASAEVPRATQQALSGRCRALLCLFKPLFQLERRMHRQGAAGDGAVKIAFHEFDICMNAVCMGDPVLWCILAARVRCKPAERCQSCSLYPYTKTAPRGSQWLFRISRQISTTLLALRSTLNVFSRSRICRGLRSCTGTLGLVESTFNDPACTALQITCLPR
jgi:hypothetical protein